MVTTNTDNFGLRKQDKGDSDWHVPLNNNVDDLDGELVIRDTEANRSDYDPATGQLFHATDTGLWYRYDGSSWNARSYVVDAKNMAGGDLATKVQNALDALPGGHGKVVISPKDDGTAWDWGSTLSVDVAASGGVEIEVLSNVRITDAPSGWAMDFTGSDTTTNRGTEQVTISGGVWDFTGAPSDFAGWLRMTDVFGSVVGPVPEVLGISNASNDCTFIQLRNDAHFSESVRIKSVFCRGFDHGIWTRGASATGGSGSNSFNNLNIEYASIEDFDGKGYWFEDSQLRGGGIYGTHLGAGSANSDIDGMHFGSGYSRNFVVVAPKFDFAPGASNQTAWLLGGPNTPFTIDPEYISVDSEVENDSAPSAALRGIGTTQDLTLFLQRSFEKSTFTLKEDGVLTPKSRSSTPSGFLEAVGNIYLDDGTNTASGDPGWRVWDGSAWVDMFGSGGGGSAEHTVRNDGSTVASDVTIHNFVGPNLTAEDGGVANAARIVSEVNEYADPAAGDLSNGEYAFDTTNSRWLYKDGGGTVHYWAADGTL